MIYAGFFGMIFVLPLYLQSLRGYTAFESGLAQSPQAVGVFLVANLLGRRLYRAIGPRRLMVVGIALDVDRHVLLLPRRAPHAVVDDRPAVAVSWLSSGLVFVSIQTAVYAKTSNADTGRATSMFNTQRQIAYAAGVAVAATVIASIPRRGRRRRSLGDRSARRLPGGLPRPSA